MEKNRLPKYWAVQNDGSQAFNTVIEYLNKIDNNAILPWTGLNPTSYYGYDGRGFNKGTFCEDSVPPNTKLLTLVEFIDLTNRWHPKRGDKVLVSDEKDKNYREEIYLTTIEGSTLPYITVNSYNKENFLKGHLFSTIGWRYLLPIEKAKPIKLTVSQIEEKLGHKVEIISDEQ